MNSNTPDIKGVTLRFDNNPEHDIVIPDISKFIEGAGMIKLDDGRMISLQPDEPIQEGREWIYTVKIIKTDKDGTTE